VINGVNKIFIFVDDQQKAKEFWTGTMGFGLHLDSEECPGAGWVEVVTPDKRTILILAQRPEGMPSTAGQRSHTAFYVDDIHKTVAELRSRGVEIANDITEEHWGLSADFKDPLGTLFNIGERTAEVQPPAPNN